MKFAKAISPKFFYYALGLIIVSFLVFPVGRPYPQIPLADAQIDFDGSRALELLTELVNNYPGREVGTPAAEDSANWIAQYFSDLGLDTRSDRYPVPYNLSMTNSVEGPVVYAADMLADAEGINVVAVSPGQVQEVIVIGAHRDVINTGEGAEDNGSGTAVMMELARVLTQEPHHYTLVFVSYDGEEVGLYGSYHLAEVMANDPVILAISIDMVGLKGATSMGLYNFVTREGQTPLWTVALARSISGANTEQQYVRSQANYIINRMMGLAPTDTQPFLAQGVPVLGVWAMQSSVDRIIHDPADTMDQISLETLTMAGRYMEQYINSVAAVPKDTNTTWIPRAMDYIPGGYYPIHLTLALASLLGLILVKLAKEKQDLRQLKSEEGKWIIIGVGLATLASLAFYGMGSDFASTRLPLIFVLIVSLALIAISALSPIVAWIIRNGKMSRQYKRRAYNFCMLLLYIAGLFMAGPLETLIFMLFPVLVMGSASDSKGGRFIQVAGWFCMLVVGGVFTLIITVSTFGQIFTLGTFLLQLWFLTLLYTTGVYILPRPILDQDMKQILSA